ncbi:MAG: heme transport system permease protein [Frankiaceae bacterium]|nr:heme transport system permease protein [Frankiaceae bacterium]
MTARVCVALGVTLLALCVVAAGAGQLHVSPAEVLGSVLHRIGVDAGPLPRAAQGENVLWLVRFPRIALAVVVGASLGCAGAVMQGVFRNPLAEPGVVGVSAGSALGAALVLVSGASALGAWTLPAGGFAGGVVASLAVYFLARSGGRTEVVTLVLTGVAVNAFAGAGIGLMTFAADGPRLRAIATFNLGSLAGATWPAVAAVLPVAVAGVAVSLRCARRLDLLALGEGAAGHLGVRVQRLTFALVVAVSLLTAAATAFTGIVVFVGLVVPHVVRLAAGPAHRVVVPASALGGAVVLVAADLVARTAVAGQELPLGVLTSLVGGPFFLWLLRRARAESGGWA